MYLLATLALSELEFWLLSDFAVGEPTACCRCVALDIFDDEDDSRYDFFSVVLVRRSTFTRELMKWFLVMRALLRKIRAQNQSKIQICVHGTAHKLNTYSKRESLSWSRRLLLAKKRATMWGQICGGFFMDEFFAKDYKMKEETKFIITTNKNTFRVLLSPPKKNHRCEYYCRKYALRTISRSHSAQTRDLAIRGTGQPAKGEQVFSGLTRDRG